MEQTITSETWLQNDSGSRCSWSQIHRMILGLEPAHEYTPKINGDGRFDPKSQPIQTPIKIDKTRGGVCTVPKWSGLVYDVIDHSVTQIIGTEKWTSNFQETF